MIESTKFWIVVLGLGLVTFAIRYSFLGLLAGRRLPDTLIKGLALVPVTVLPALVAPMVFRAPEGGLGLDPAVLAAAVATVVVGALTRNVLAGVAGGTAGFALVRLMSG
ncbi:MAG: AzlD domain-containing protein [Pseudomonadota bacterium]